ncbi:MAG: protein kinase domain-containing protein [Gammaproteobacteria bacterium]
MTAALAAESYTCPRCGERSTKGEISGKGFHCPRCTLELAHLEVAPNGTVRQVLGWLLAPGELLQGRYRVSSVLGKGGFAATYLVTDERLQGKRRALKEVPRDLYDEHETGLLARLRHPAIPDISDHFEMEGMGYLVLEFGGTQSLEGERKASGGTIAVERLVPWMRQLCEVLAYLHGQVPPVVHRDLKPENILLDEDDRIMLIDFGIAKESAELAVTRTLARSVSHGFSPPEQVLGTGTDQRSDVYALGATMYALLTGTVPPAAHERVAGKEITAPRALNPAIPETLESVILQALDLNLKLRPQTIAKLSCIFAPGTLDAPPPAPGLSTRTVRVGEQMPLPAPVRASIRVRQASVAPPAAARHGRRVPSIAAGGLVAVAAVLAAWRLLEPSSPATARSESPAIPVAAIPAAPLATPTESPPTPQPGLPQPPRAQELGGAGPIIDEGLRKKELARVVATTPEPSPSPSPSTRPVTPDPVPKVAPPLDLTGTNKAVNQKQPPVAVAPSPSRSPNPPPAKTQATRGPATKVAPPLDLIDKVHDR